MGPGFIIGDVAWIGVDGRLNGLEQQSGDAECSIFDNEFKRGVDGRLYVVGWQYEFGAECIRSIPSSAGVIGGSIGALPNTLEPKASSSISVDRSRYTI